MKQNIIARLFKMIGNISKKKGDNGDFYTKPVVDKKIKEAEAATKAYTDKAAADAKNDLYAEVGKKVGAVEETVNARLDSTDTKLDTKVDKVSGKSLIDSGVAVLLDTDGNGALEIYPDCGGPTMRGSTEVKIDSEGACVRVVTGETRIGYDGITVGHENSLDSHGDVTVYETALGETSATFKTHKLSEKANAADVGTLSDLTTTDKSSIVAAINEVKSSGGGDVLDNLTYDSTKDIINSSANLLLENSASVAAYNGTFRGDITIGQLGANKWAYRISPITGFSTSVDVTCTSGNVVHNLAAKADTTNVLTRNNTQAFTPTGDYQPATKKYVDDAIAALKLELGLD